MDSSAELINKAKTCLQQKDYLQAEEIFNEALREEPDNQQAYFELGKICCIRQKYSEALEKLNKAISLEYNDACAHFLLAKAYKGLNQLQDALSEFKKALELGYEDNEDVHKDLYFIYRDLNKFSPAIEEFKRAFTTVSPELYQSELGKIYRGQFRLIENYNFEGRHSQAIEEIGRLKKLSHFSRTWRESCGRGERYFYTKALRTF
jgi:tetratricopeptide (TPR) repeat protein